MTPPTKLRQRATPIRFGTSRAHKDLVIPIFAENAPDCPTGIAVADGVADLVLTNGRILARALKALELHIDPNAAELDPT